MSEGAMKPTVWVYILVTALIAALVGMVIALSNASDLRSDLEAAQGRAEEAEDASEEVSNSLEDVEDDLARLRRAQRKIKAASPTPEDDLDEQLANGTAVPTEGLSVSLPADFWDCTRWKGNRCVALKDEAVFKNETQIASAITCVFDVTYEDGSTTNFFWTSPLVPAGGGTSTAVVYFYSDYPSGIDLLGESGDCYRGSANPGGGE